MKRKCRLEVTLAVLLVAYAAPGARADETDNYLKQKMKELHIAGSCLAVVRQGRTAKIRGYGLADVELKVPVTPHTVFEIGSLTKQFTSVCILSLIENKKLGLQDRITDYIPGLPESWANITISHLLTHTSGIPSYVTPENFESLPLNEYSKEDIIKLVEDLPLEFQPGENIQYTSTGYYLLGMIIERVSGESYWDFLDGHILKPLRLTATRQSDPTTIIPLRAAGYSWFRGRFQNRRHVTASSGFAAGSLVSSAVDLLKWCAALSTDKLLNQSSLEEMWTPVRLSNGKLGVIETLGNYGFGWAIDSIEGHRLVYHTGGTPGFSCIIARFVDDGVTIILLTNKTIFPFIKSIASEIAAFYIHGMSRTERSPARKGGK